MGTAGRLRPWKGQARFIRVASAVASAWPEVRFLIVGGIPFGESSQYRSQLEQLAVRLKVEDRIIFTGHLDDPSAAYAAMDIFVHPGDPEPFGLVNIEAMAMRLPVVAFSHGALPEIVESGQTGILVSPGDEAAMSKAVAELVRDRAKRNSMGSAGRHRVEAMFSADRMVSEVSEILDGMLD